MIRRNVAVSLLVTLVALGMLQPAFAQSATMQQWEDDVLLMIRDREGSTGGMMFDRGIQRRYTAGMDHEYHLDLRGARFSSYEDATFFTAESGVRTYTASIHKSRFATTTDVRHRLDLGTRHEVSFRGRQQDDLSARRFFVEGGYALRFNGHHHIGFTQTMASFKPDLDTELYYETRDPVIGRLRAGILLLNAFNNAIFDGLGVDPVLQDTLRSYTRSPRLIRARWLSPRLGNVFLEAFVGLQPVSAATITTYSDPDFRLDIGERLGYGLFSVTGEFGWLDAGAYVSALRERTTFSADRASSAYRDYAVEQRETRYGLRSRARIGVTGRQHIEIMIDAGLLRFRDQQTGDDFSAASIPEAFHLREDRLELQAQVGWVPNETGLRATLRWISDHRRYSDDIQIVERHYLRFAQWSPNTRLSLLIGYDFLPTFRLEAGASFDVDGDRFYTDGRGATRFDGGFGRVQLTW